MTPKNKLVYMVSISITMIFLFFGKVNAGIYDDFTNIGIDANKWKITGSGFSQPGDGYLYFNDKTADPSKLVSTMHYSSGVFTMLFSDYSSNNLAPANQNKGTIAGIGLSAGPTDYVRIERGQVLGSNGGPVGYLEVNWFDQNGVLQENYINFPNTDFLSGALQLRYDGSVVTFWYQGGTNGQWSQMMLTDHGQPLPDQNGQPQPFILTPDWITPVAMFIQAYPGDPVYPNVTLSFKVDRVEAPVPEPITLLFLCSSLIGLVGLRRKFRNS
jgi:hypothetical protein